MPRGCDEKRGRDLRRHRSRSETTGRSDASGGVCSRTSVPASCPRPASRGRPARNSGILEDWIKFAAFGIDPKDPDPGRVTVRRLNRIEYRNTIRDLIGVDYDTTAEFPPDDTGHGFDNIGDVLTMSPLLLEKYIAAANFIVSRPCRQSRESLRRRRFPAAPFAVPRTGPRPARTATGPLSLSYYDAGVGCGAFQAEHDGRYRLILDLTATERFVDGVNDYNKCRLVFKVDGEELLRREYGRQDGKLSLRGSIATGRPARTH